MSGQGEPGTEHRRGGSALSSPKGEGKGTGRKGNSSELAAPQAGLSEQANSN